MGLQFSWIEANLLGFFLANYRNSRGKFDEIKEKFAINPAPIASQSSLNAGGSWWTRDLPENLLNSFKNGSKVEDRDRDLNRKTQLRTRGTLWRVRFSSNRDLHLTAGKTSGRSPRSWRDRAAIVTPSWRNHLHDLQKAFNGGLRSWSTHDRGPIAARSWPYHGAIVALFEVKL